MTDTDERDDIEHGDSRHVGPADGAIDSIR